MSKDLINTLTTEFSTKLLRPFLSEEKIANVITPGTLEKPVSQIKPKVEDEMEETKFNFFQPLDDQTTTSVSSKKLEDDPKFIKLLGSLTLHMMDNGLKIDPLPNIELIDNDNKNADDILGKTAYYDPNSHSIILYTCNRHPKDILRSYAHEMIHHMQNLENRINNIQGQNINEDDYLAELEREAYEKGNMLFRGWENNLKND
jgi:hypothetical protein